MLIAGVDASYGQGKATVAGVVCKYPEQKVVEKKIDTLPGSHLFPYIPGLLFLREGPLIIATLRKLENPPHVLIVNGHGKAHPTGFGLAVFVENVTGIPTIGCTREILVGKYRNFKLLRGRYTFLVYKNRKIGIALCTRDNTRPLIISSGGKLNFKKIYEICLLTTKITRWPYPLYLADKESKRSIPEQD